MTPSVRRLWGVDDAAIDQLTDLLIDCVDGGASVSFMLPLSRERAQAFWRRIADDVASGARALLVAEDDSGICGTVQLILDLPENQPHRVDLAKLLVHRRARRQGEGRRSRGPRRRPRATAAGRCSCSTPSRTASQRVFTRASGGAASETSRGTRYCRAAVSAARPSSTGTSAPRAGGPTISLSELRSGRGIEFDLRHRIVLAVERPEAQARADRGRGDESVGDFDADYVVRARRVSRLSRLTYASVTPRSRRFRHSAAMPSRVVVRPSTCPGP